MNQLHDAYWLRAAHNISASSYSLAHVESEVDVLLLGEEQNEKVIPRLTLLDGRIQTDLLRRQKEKKKTNTEEKCDLGINSMVKGTGLFFFFWSIKKS